ncbi:hypothetical protein HU200_000472 [Digitaria exilis]|uniref:Uncharacterized protein n=1 Tax=Digitaria exilis TaxID=1010633 RepID=A0A835G2Y9_9POAL|nr:hypothetical protein HU200_000472 [Digitaria exilis]
MSAVEPAVAAAEYSAGGEDTEPGLADDGGADEVCWFVRRDTEEDLFDEVLRQRRHCSDGRWGIGLDRLALCVRYIWNKRISQSTRRILSLDPTMITFSSTCVFTWFCRSPLGLHFEMVFLILHTIEMFII